jgi:F-type H+-transporting ATPase subunit beta
MDELSPEDKALVKRARRVQRFFSQPFHVAEKFSGYKGVYVPVEKTIEGVEMILNVELDYIPEQYFLMCGSIDDVINKYKEEHGDNNE